MSALARRIRTELGTLGLAAVILLAGAASFLVLVIQPMEREHQQLLDRLSGHATEQAGSDSAGPEAATASAKLVAFYQFFDRPEQPSDWLAKLYAIATSSGVQLRSADYRLIETRERLARYRIVLPIKGRYSQIRAFLENALNDIPILSLDRASFQRDQVDQSEVSAQITLTLRWLKR